MFYCNVVWGGGADVHINKMLILQKRVVRVVTHSDYLEHTGHLFQNLILSKIHSIYRYLCSLLVYKNKNIYESVNNRYGTRNCNIYECIFKKFLYANDQSSTMHLESLMNYHIKLQALLI